MFDIFFGWRKASKCKKLIKRVQCRLKLLKNKRFTIVKQLREDLASLIKVGNEETAFNRVEQLVQDENMIAFYELLDHFCEFIITNMPYIQKHKDCPNDIHEAVSSLIFASARCGDLPELCVIRKLFAERYGQRFAAAALELLPGNLVNREIKERLSISSVLVDVKLRLLEEIARDSCLGPEILALEFPSELQQQANQNSGERVLERDTKPCFEKLEGPQIQESNAKEMERKAVDIDSSQTMKNFSTAIALPRNHQHCDVITARIDSSAAQQSSPDKLDSPIQEKEKNVKNFPQVYSVSKSRIPSPDTKGNQQSGRIFMAAVQSNEDGVAATASSSESLPQFLEEKVVYLDDINELKSSKIKDAYCQDQRLFKFKSHSVPVREKTIEGKDEVSIGQYESSSEKSDSQASKKRGKRPRRLASQKNLFIDDIESEIYYDTQFKTSPSHKHRSSHYRRRHPKKTQVEQSERSYNMPTRQKQRCSRELGSEIQTDQLRSCCDTCSLDQPCYCFIVRDKDDFKSLAPKRKNPCEKARGCSRFQESFSEIERANPPVKPRRRSCDNSGSVYTTFIYPSQEKRMVEEKCDSPTRKTVSAYSRNMTMPQERSNRDRVELFTRSNSCSSQNPSHVHPKLPEYDDIAAKFLALKEEHMQNNKKYAHEANKRIGRNQTVCST